MPFNPWLRSRKTRFFPWLTLGIVVLLCCTLGLDYFISPASSQVPPAQSCSRGASAGYLTPRLHVGDAGHSVHVGNLNIRQQPGTQGRSIGSLAPGATFTVLEGPACVGDYVWWKLNTGRVQGWVAEGEPSSSTYWLVSNTTAQRPPSTSPTQARPTLEPIVSQDGSPSSSYRLTMSGPNDIVFVFCPANYAPKLGYLRNVEAVQCEPI